MEKIKQQMFDDWFQISLDQCALSPITFDLLSILKGHFAFSISKIILEKALKVRHFNSKMIFAIAMSKSIDERAIINVSICIFVYPFQKTFSRS